VTELRFKGKEFVHHLSVPLRPLVPHAGNGICAVNLDGSQILRVPKLALRTFYLL
jgi:adenine-specific DNA-methyltransferase